MGKKQIIVLNGTSSSGKTSIAKELQTVLEEPYTYIAIDQLAEFLESYLPEGYTPNKQNEDKQLTEAFHFIRPSMVSLFHHTIKTLAMLEHRIIVDHVILDKEWLEECLGLLADEPVLFVGIYCSIEELERREKERGDRKLGLAKLQLDHVHQYANYDLEIDTTNNSARECAKAIKNFLEKSQ
ncbi:chloramphenicol phosphotransferase CPT family protein [Halalkalibacter urbisdiaboli]|uniref:chloramphenicol phosphotransferase CPT family protein n=1 Tax=Halalkalibacter urbisdiaboli TaxID=1960589 RepID=UPI0013FDD9FF|nr:hypothetical protein [Halalkalibacter urbisdiaboli]